MYASRTGRVTHNRKVDEANTRTVPPPRRRRSPDGAVCFGIPAQFRGANGVNMAIGGRTRCSGILGGVWTLVIVLAEVAGAVGRRWKPGPLERRNHEHPEISVEFTVILLIASVSWPSPLHAVARCQHGSSPAPECPKGDSTERRQAA